MLIDTISYPELKSTFNFSLTWGEVDYTTSSLQKKVSREHSQLLNRAELVVIHALISFIKPAGYCWPGAALLSKETRYSIYTVRRAIRSLIAAGYVKRRLRGATSPLYLIDRNKILRGGIPVIPRAVIPDIEPFEPVHTPVESANNAPLEVEKCNPRLGKIQPKQTSEQNKEKRKENRKVH